MKKMKQQLTWVSKTLAGLSKQVDKLARQISHMGSGDGRSGLTVKRSSARGPLARRDTVLESVYEAIKTSRRKGISIPELRSRTGLGARQLSNALYKLTKKGIIQTQSRGIYVKK
jgi:hypothetical protein